MPLISNNFFATIPYGPIVNAIFENVVFNLNLEGMREKLTDSFRDFPGDPGSKTMMHVGPIAYTEAIYDRIKKCADVKGNHLLNPSRNPFTFKLKNLYEN